jgi:DNA repair exonuclease SbcCD ATPase subunit
MKLLKIELQGYRSFAQPEVIDFTSMAPGLYHVQGRNEVEPELEANGAGKSTLFEAPHWCLYGKTSRGVRAGAVKSWDSKGQCVVVTDWQTPSGLLSVLRAWGPNSLEIIEGGAEPRTIDQTELDHRMFPQSIYLFSMFFAQFAPTFIDLSPAEQSAVFTDVLVLGIWERAVKTAMEDVRKLDQLLQEQINTRAHIVGQLDELSTATYEEEEKKWHADHKIDVKNAKTECAIVEKEEDACRVRVGNARVAAVELREAQEKDGDICRAVSSANGKIYQINQDLIDLRAGDYKTCPTCGAPVDNKHIRKEIAKKQKELDEVVLAYKKAKVRQDASFQVLSKLKGQGTALIEAEKAWAVAKVAVRTAENRLELVRDTDNPYTKQREAADLRGQRLVAELDTLDSKISALTAQHAITEYWIKGFKEIRLSLINESLSQLTIEANEVLFQMGLQDWQIEFDVERENKTGGINKNFTVLIHSPHTEAAVPWEAWSGGEAQRLRLAITMGFANLVNSRAGIQPNVEMWDEPSTGLSEAGIQDMLQVFADRARRYNKIILLADHRALDFGGFAGTITVVKDQNGSHIE